MSITRTVLAILVSTMLASRAHAQQDKMEPVVQAPADTITVQYSPPLIMTRSPRPVYPESARGTKGWVRVECVVTPQGRIESVRIVASEPAGLFDQAAIDAMKKARFKPFKSSQPKLMVQRLIFSPG
jgi:TonB family protein